MQGSVADSINLSVYRNRNDHFYRDKLREGVQLLRGRHDRLMGTEVPIVGHALSSNDHQPSGRLEKSETFPSCGEFFSMGVASRAKKAGIVEIYTEPGWLSQRQNVCHPFPARDVSH